MTTVAEDNSQGEQSTDLMISYHPDDLDSVKQLAEALRADGLKVWYADPENPDMNVKGQMVSSTKVFLLVLSQQSAQDPQCKDELALAYITNSAIFPLGLERFRSLDPYVDCGMKLMLAKINWTFFTKPEEFETNYPGLLSGVLEGLATSPEKNFDFDNEDPFSFLGSICHINPDNNKDMSKKDFWLRYFEDKDEVSWSEFKTQFLADYGEEIKNTYTEENLNEKFFLNLIYKDIFNSSRTVKWTKYDKFCDGNPLNLPDCFYDRLQDYARGLYAMKEVFNMESTLRLSAVQNLGKFSTPSVVGSLHEMLTDADPNIRAVAAIALARSHSKSKKTVNRLLKGLEDEDRLVRESVCFSLGFLQANQAVQAIADKWRNDPISHVRNAAAEALKMIETPEAQKCVHMTDVLTEEMKSLRNEDNH